MGFNAPALGTARMSGVFLHRVPFFVGRFSDQRSLTASPRSCTVVMVLLLNCVYYRYLSDTLLTVVDACLSRWRYSRCFNLRYSRRSSALSFCRYFS